MQPSGIRGFSSSGPHSSVSQIEICRVWQRSELSRPSNCWRYRPTHSFLSHEHDKTVTLHKINLQHLKNNNLIILAPRYRLSHSLQIQDDPDTSSVKPRPICLPPTLKFYILFKYVKIIWIQLKYVELNWDEDWSWDLVRTRRHMLSGRRQTVKNIFLLDHETQYHI